jgi:hypothetical protein
VEGDTSASFAIARIDAMGLSASSSAAFSLPAALSMGRTRPSLPTLVVD